MTAAGRARILLHGLLADIATMALAAYAFIRNVDPSSTVLGGDIDGSFLNAPLALHRALSSWTDHAGLGSDATPSHAAIPILGFETLLHYLHFAPAAIQWTTLGSLYLLVPLAMILYCRIVFADDLLLRVIATLCATFNFYHAITWYTPLPVYEAGLAAGLATAAAIVAFAVRRTLVTAVALVAVTALTATAGSNVAGSIVVIALIACLVVIALIKRPELRARIVMPVVICATLNLFWLVPTIYFFSSQQETIRSSDYVTVWSDYALTATSEAATMPNLVRLIGTWDWTHTDGHGHKYVRFAEAYDNNLLLVALSFVVPLLAGLAFLRIKMAPVRFALIAGVVALFLMKGIAPPFGQLYEFAYRHLPGFLMFRVPFSKFGLAAAPLMALLAGIGFSAATERLSNGGKIASTAVAAFLIAASVSSYWSGLMFRHNEYVPTYYVKFPDSYFAVADLLNRKPNQQTRAIVLPFSPQLSYTAFDWNFNGPDPLSYLVNRPLILEPASWADPFTHLALSGIDRTPEALSEAATDNAIEYVIVHRDILSSFYNAWSAPATENLVAEAGFKLIWFSQDDKLALYKRALRPYTGIDFSSRGYLLADDNRDAARSFFGGDVFGPTKLPAAPIPKLVPLTAAPFVYMATLRPNHTFVFRCIDDRLARSTALPTFTGAEVFYDRRLLQPNEVLPFTEGWHEVQVTSSASPIGSMRISAQTPTSVRFILRPRVRDDQLIVTFQGNNHIGAIVRVVADGLDSIPNSISIDGPLRVLLVSAKGPLRTVFVDMVGPDIARLARAGVFRFQTATLTTNAAIRFPLMLRATTRVPVAATPAEAGRWSAPVENPWRGGKSSIIADRISSDVHIVRLEERADIHSRIENVRPGTRYQISFVVSNSVDRSALIYVYDEKLRTIAHAQVAERVRNSVIRFQFRNPNGNHVCYLYLYLPKTGPGPVDVTVSRAGIDRLRARAISLRQVGRSAVAVFTTGGAAQEDVTDLRSQVTVVDRRHPPSATSSDDRVALPNLEPVFSDTERAAWMPAAGYLSLESITNDHWVGYLNGIRLTKADRRGLYNAWYVPQSGLVRLRYEPQGVFKLSSVISLIALLFVFTYVFLTRLRLRRVSNQNAR